jgi:hypothetical protein
MRIVTHGTPASFLARAGGFLGGQREAEHHLILGVVAGLSPGAADAYLATVENDERVVAAAMRTPPFNLAISVAAERRSTALLAGDRATGDPALPGVLGPPSEAGAFAARYAELTGRRLAPGMRQAIHRLWRVVAPRRADGRMRRARRGDGALVVEWLAGFQRDVWGTEPDADTAAAMAERWFADPVGRALYLWEVADRPVSMTGASGATPRGIRIGAVYTPREDRGRGYASNLVAAVSQAQLDAGRTFCFLYTDLANPTSNRIYRAIGYEPVAEAMEFTFAP